MIQLNNIKKVFQTEEVETWALRNISLQVKEGEFVAIMGPSGCGKSTLLNIIGLLNNPTSGSYLLDGKDVSTLKESERTLIRRGMIGFVFQSFNLIEELTDEVVYTFSIASLCPVGYVIRRSFKRKPIALYFFFNSIS